jgi:hypothetical protein
MLQKLKEAQLTSILDDSLFMSLEWTKIDLSFKQQVFLAAHKTSGPLETEHQSGYRGKGLILKCPWGIAALGDVCSRRQGTPSYD